MRARCRRHARRCCIAILLAGFVPAVASAEPEGTARSSPALEAVGGTAGAEQDRLSAARERRERAVKAYDDGSLEIALLEFRRAYELAPTFRLLFNLAMVSRELRDYAQATAYFERYLSEGGSEIPPARRTAVETALRELMANTILVRVHVNALGAEIFVDDHAVGRAPLSAPLRLNAGFRRISARAAGRLPDARAVQLAGGEAATIELVLLLPAVEQRQPVAAMSRPVPWLAWGGTAVLAASAVFSGAEALAADRRQERLLGDLGVTRASLDRADRSARRWSLAADALGASALALGLYSAYLTFLIPGAEQPELAASIQLQLSPD
ncbi:MAG: hypothetical protein RL033_1090, partial [Pseudomonadota bacterium]